MEYRNRNKNYKYSNVEFHGNTVVLYINYCLFLENKTYEYADEIVEQLDKLDNDDTVKVITISYANAACSFSDFKQKWNSFFEKIECESLILRTFTIYNQVFLKIKSLRKVVISIYSACLNPMLFNFGIAADIRIVSNDFYIDNDNLNMIDIPKGGSIYSECSITTRINPYKLPFLSDNLLSTELLKNNLVDMVIYKDNFMQEALAIAKRYECLDYLKAEVTKDINLKRLHKLGLALQSENEFLMSCIRKRRNTNTQEILWFH